MELLRQFIYDRLRVLHVTGNVRVCGNSLSRERHAAALLHPRKQMRILPRHLHFFFHVFEREHDAAGEIAISGDD